MASALAELEEVRSDRLWEAQLEYFPFVAEAVLDLPDLQGRTVSSDMTNRRNTQQVRSRPGGATAGRGLQACSN